MNCQGRASDCIITDALGNKMKPILFTAYSDSHAQLFDKHFLPSFQQTGLDKKWELETFHLDRIGGTFGTVTFNARMMEIMIAFREVLKRIPGQTVITCGCDIRFYQDFTDEVLVEMKKHELVSIDDNYGLACCDFFAFKVSPRIISLYDWVIQNDRMFTNNEFTFNHGIMELGIHLKMLPIEFYTVGLTNGGNVWLPGDPVNPPTDMKLHHANFTLGVEDKMALLDSVLEYQSRPKTP